MLRGIKGANIETIIPGTCVCNEMKELNRRPSERYIPKCLEWLEEGAPETEEGCHLKSKRKKNVVYLRFDATTAG